MLSGFFQIFQKIDISGSCALDESYSLVSFQAAPSLLLYSYIPAIIIALILSFLVFKHNKKDNSAKAFLFFSVFYSLWVINAILQWIAIPNKALFFFWQLNALFEIGFYLSTLYLLISFISKEVLSTKIKWLFVFLFFLILGLTPSILNIQSYDYDSCEGQLGSIWKIIYAFEFLVSAIILIYGIVYAKKKENLSRRKEILLFSIPLFFFVSLFTASNIGSGFLEDYSFELFGPIGMVIFISFVAYLIVKYKTFNIKLLATQALVWGLVALIGSQFFFIKVTTNFILNGVTFIGVIIFGQFLIKSVKKEIEQKEELVKLYIDLEDLLKQRESLVHLVTHKVKGSFTRSKYIFAGILDGTFGVINEEVKKRAEQGLESDNMGIETVDVVLNAANLEKGVIKYEMKNIDLKELVEKTISEKKISAEAKGLRLEAEIKDDVYNVLGDSIWLKEVANNLIENSIKYTKEGKITAGLEKKNKKILFYVKDTGIGISPEDRNSLFTEGGRGKDSVKINVDSTGYGLYSVKMIVEAHKGKVWMEPNKDDVGSTFFVELDVV